MLTTPSSEAKIAQKRSAKQLHEKSTNIIKENYMKGSQNCGLANMTILF
jgi:hypothetical protein